ncbi:cyclic pyranopterin monophosphate synthase [Gammaproteobacteria bacterium]
MKKKKTIKFSHLDDQGVARMVDVSSKIPQKREATAQGKIFLAPLTCQLIKANKIKKGDVLSIARIAGIQAAKQTAQLIPLCHPLILDNIEVKLKMAKNYMVATSTGCCVGRTGIEMEVLTAVSVSLLTIYDMCKAVDKKMKISNIYLLSKVKAIDRHS